MTIDLFHPIGTKKPSLFAPLADLHAYYHMRRYHKDRAAMLACCFLLPSALALVLHLSW